MPDVVGLVIVLVLMVSGVVFFCLFLRYLIWDKPKVAFWWGVSCIVTFLCVIGFGMTMSVIGY